jgi:hypothetical protein
VAETLSVAPHLARPSVAQDAAVPQCALATVQCAVVAAQCAVLTAVADAAQVQPSSAVEPATRGVEQCAVAPQRLVLLVLEQMRLWPVLGQEQLAK